MNKHFEWIGLFTIAAFLYAPPGFTQDDTAVSEDADLPADQEVEVNEDNYRQFMELKDARGQRNILPENAFKSQAGKHKLDELPEDSQKHLRNQLREIIVQGDPWQPGDEETEYPYVPSEAANTDQSLQEQEAEAWEELVDGYHQREAEIYANSSRSKAAAAPAGASGGGSGDDEGSANRGAGQAGVGQQAGQQDSSEQSSAADSYSPNSSNSPHDPDSKSTAGVSQNAMEFLKGKGSFTGATGQADAQAGQQSESEQNRRASPSSANTTPSSSNESNADSTAGAYQNALEYLVGEDIPSGAAAQAAPPSPVESEDTLSIEDLLNARGVSGATGTEATGTNDEQDSDDNSPDRDGGT